MGVGLCFRDIIQAILSSLELLGLLVKSSVYSHGAAYFIVVVLGILIVSA